MGRRRGHGDGRIVKTPSGRHLAELRTGLKPDGSYGRVSKTLDTEREAKNWLREQRLAVERGQPLASCSTRLGQWLDEWLVVVKPNVAPLTYLPYERDVECLKRFAANWRLDRVTSVWVQNLYTRMLAAGVSAAMTKKAGGTLGTALQHAVLLRLLPFNPARDVPRPRHRPKEHRAMSVEQVGQFLVAASEHRLYSFFVAWLDTGMRESELFALLWQDVSTDCGAFAVMRTLENVKGLLRLKELKTQKSRRRVVLGAFAQAALLEHRKQALAAGRCAPDAAVWPAPCSPFMQYGNFRVREFMPLLKKAGLGHFRPYDLRHSCASLLGEAGVDPKVIGERLGHSTTRLTLDTYMHVFEGMQRGAAEQISGVMERAIRRAQGG